MTKGECLAVFLALLAFWTGLECGYRIRKNGEGPRTWAERRHHG